MGSEVENDLDFQAASLRIAKRHGLDLKRLGALLKKTDPTPQKGKPDSLWQTTGLIPANQFKWCLQNLLEHCEPNSVIDILESENLRIVFNRVAFMTYVMDSVVPFYSKDELKLLLGQFVEYLQINRETLIKTGYPAWRFGASIWLDWGLADLYRTKLPAFVTFKKNKAGNTECTYKWVKERLDHPVPHRLFLGSPYPLNVREYGDAGQGWMDKDKRLTPSSYENAPPMGGLSVNHAYIMERGRSAILDVKIEILKEAEKALVHNDDAVFWQRCFSFIQNTFHKSEIRFFFTMDYPPFIKAYEHVAASGNSAGPVCGGLTCLINLIGHVESELKIGAYSKSREALGNLFLRTKDGQGRFNLPSGWFTESERSRMSKAMELSASLLCEHQKFKTLFLARIDREIENSLLDEVSVNARVRPDMRPEAERLMKDMAVRIEKLAKGTRPHEDEKETEVKPIARDTFNQFSFKGDFWLIRYAGKSINVKDSKGMKLISVLLNRPRTDMSPTELVNLFNKPDPDALSKSQARTDSDLLPSGDSSQLSIDEQTISTIKKKIVELREDIQDAINIQDSITAEKARSEIDSLVAFLNKNTYRGKVKLMNSTMEKDRKSVGIAIRRAIETIQQTHEELAAHLTNSIRGRNNGYSYLPEAKTYWTVN